MATAPGSPVWIDLGTSDQEASRDFYRELFGWNFTSTGPDFGGYEMVDVGVPVGGLGPNMNADGEIDESMPVSWTVYLKVADIEVALDAVEASGGTVVVPPMAIGDMGRMAIVAAPSGASFGLWETGTFDGFDVDGRPGTGVWFETLTRDFDADAACYAAVLGWENALMEGEGRYATNHPGDGATAGLCEAGEWLPEGVPSYWRVYFGVEDTDASIERVKDLGGSLLDGPIDSPFGRVATVADSLGGAFQIIQPPA